MGTPLPATIPGKCRGQAPAGRGREQRPRAPGRRCRAAGRGQRRLGAELGPAWTPRRRTPCPRPAGGRKRKWSSGSRRSSRRAAPECKCVCSSGERGRGWARDSGRPPTPRSPARQGHRAPATRPRSRVTRAPCAGSLHLRGCCPATPGRFVKFPGLAPRPGSLTSARPGRELGLGQGGGSSSGDSGRHGDTFVSSPGAPRLGAGWVGGGGGGAAGE